VFDIGSTSKQFTAASVLLLEKQGKLSVNDDVRKYIPELPDYGRTITILHLLNHTSGLRDYLELMWLAAINFDSVTTDDDALQIVVRQRATNFPPGTDWLYSNTGYFLLSLIVKRVSGKTLREFASESIFVPLQMTHTQFGDDHTALIANRVLAYDPSEKEGGYALEVSYFEQTGDGAVHTSVQDLQRWDENFYTGQVGGAAFLAEMQEQGRLNNGKVLDYAKGLFIADYRGLRTVSHGGAWGGYRAELLRFPDQHFSVACLCNRGDANPSRKAQLVAEIYLGSLMRPSQDTVAARGGPGAAAVTEEQLANVSGTYRDVTTGAMARVALRNHRLVADILGTKTQLRAASPTEFVTEPAPETRLVFEPASDGAPKRMRIASGKGAAADYEAVAEYAPSAAELNAHAGDYASDELAVSFRLGMVEDKLKLVAVLDPAGLKRSGGIPLDELRPALMDEFEVGGTSVTLHFARNVEHAITAFTLDAGRARGIVFTRHMAAEKQ
jgi:CubicO group peptidase (beta-lactamase class C family)